MAVVRVLCIASLLLLASATAFATPIKYQDALSDDLLRTGGPVTVNFGDASISITRTSTSTATSTRRVTFTDAGIDGFILTLPSASAVTTITFTRFDNSLHHWHGRQHESLVDVAPLIGLLDADVVQEFGAVASLATGVSNIGGTSQNVGFTANAVTLNAATVPDSASTVALLGIVFVGCAAARCVNAVAP
jgi:hypothetical protein